MARYSEAVAGLVLVAFSAFALLQTLAIPGAARIFPLLTVGALGFFSVIYLGRSLLAPRDTGPLVTRADVFLVVLVLTIVYVNLAVAIGYITATILYIPAVAWLIGFRRPVYISVVTVVYLVSVYALFELVFGRALPSELLFDLVRRAA